MVLSKCAICCAKKSGFTLGLKTLFSCVIGYYLPLNTIIKMSEIVNKVLLAGDKFMPEMNLKEPGFT